MNTMAHVSSSSSSSKSSLSPPPHHPSHFTPIQECEREGNEDETPNGCTEKREVVVSENHHHHQPTPLHQSEKRGRPTTRKRPESDAGAGEDRGVNCNKCRPSNRDKISIVPLDNRSSISSPNGLLKSIFSLMKKSPIPRSFESSTEPTPLTANREEQWKIAVAELSHKLIQATRKRDEALIESSKLKCSMAELERKLNKLEIYCHNLKSGLEFCSNTSLNPNPKHKPIKIGDDDRVIESFLVSISESRSSIRVLSRSLAVQIRSIGNKVYDRLSLLLQPYDIKVSLSKNPRTLLFYLEALLNRAFYEDFESIGFQKSGSNRVLNPIDRCEANFAAFEHLQSLTWDDVLNRGTRHFSEEFSKFCDRKMSEIVAMLGWTRAWPEPLLQAFFGASKGVWLVHLLANSVHPGLPIFRVETGSGFDSVYMEDMGGDKARRLVPGTVRVMVTPGFYVYGNVVKCKVLCRYQSNNGNINDSSEKGLTLSPK